MQKEKPQQACGSPSLRSRASSLLAVLILVDALADAVLLTIDPFLLGLGEVAVVLRHVLLFVVLHAGLALLEMRCLLRIQFPALHAVANTPLLVLLPSVHFIDARMAGIDNARARSRSSSCGLSRGGASEHKSPDCQD